MHHVIVGAGPAGVIAAETLRKLDRDCSITLIGDEPEPPYSRMALPYLLIDRIDERGTYLRKSDRYYDQIGVEVRTARVASVSAAEHRLTLDGGESLNYDKLLLATGSRATKPPIEGTDLPGVHPCWTLADARNIAALATRDAKVSLMGAGFIGCIILEALASRGVDLTVIEMENRMVPRMMNEQSGGLIKKWCEGKGVTVLTSTRVAAIQPDTGAHSLSVHLEGGDAHPADLVICATGVLPNTDVLSGAGIEIDQGVLVNHYLQTNDSDVFAAGDVARGKDFSTGEYSVQAIQPTAVEHGHIAATNMVKGQDIAHQGCVNMNVLDTMGLVSASFGAWQGAEGGDSAELYDPGRYRYLNLQFKDDVLVGANSLGLTQHVGVLRGLIQSRLHLAHWKERLLQNPIGIMEAYMAVTQGIGTTPKVA